MQLNNTEPRLATFTVSFSYERYKFYNDGPDINKTRKVETGQETSQEVLMVSLNFLTEKND